MPPKFAENQSNASEADLQYKSPLEFKEERFKGGVEQTTASEAAISQTPWNPVPEFAGTGHGTMQITANMAELDKTPIHGWTSYPATPSIRAVKQSK